MSARTRSTTGAGRTTTAEPGIEVLARGTWPEAGDEVPAGPPRLAGFVVSSFSPLAAEAANRCLRAHHGEAPVPPERGDRTAVVVVSRLGDFTTDRAVGAAVVAGRPVQPLLFFQSVPNAVVGHVATAWGLRGPVVCFSPEGDQEEAALDYARLLFEDGEADEALLVLVESAVEEGVHGSATALLAAPRDGGVVVREGRP
ncbi:beta-ketoacyl synthase chain length factor [Streptomyces sp. NPDC090077]|uniref:beta-ketoacyl synthase chain length factor n=1 Tax=Streptomyces sp. NPDC090077 TaxID=3365938 RepID=UPI003820AAD2